MLKSDGIGAQAKNVVDEVRKGLGKVTMPVQLTLDPGVTQKLNAEMVKLQASIKPLTIPVNFGTPGGMPSGGGTPWGASSLNLPMLMAQQTQQIIQGLTPSQSPNWSYLMRGGGASPGPGGGGAGSGSMFNPLGPRGLARMLGSGVAAYGALEAINVTTGLLNASDTARHPERQLREMEHFGSMHNAGDDPFMHEQAKTMASQAAGKEMREAFETIPVIGSLAKFSEAVLGSARAAESAEKTTRRITEGHEAVLKTRDANDTRGVEQTGDNRAALLKQQADERRKFTNNFSIVRSDLEDAKRRGDKTAIGQAQKNMDDLRAEWSTTLDQQSRELDLFDQDEGTKDSASGTKVRGSRYAATAAGQRQSGNPLGAMLTQQKGARESSWQKYQDQLDRTDLDPRERTRLEAEQSAAMSALAAQQRLEYGTAATGVNLGREGLRARSDELGSRLSGNPDEAARKTLKAEQDRQYEELKLRDAGMAAIYKNEVAPKEREQQEKEIAARRISEATETAQRIKDIEGRAQDEVLRAQGHTYEAMENESKRQTASRIADLERQATAMDSIDKKRAGQLRDEAAAEKKAGKDRLDAIEAAASREADVGLRRADNDANVAQMEAGGHNFAAHKQAIEDRHSEEVDKIMREGGDDVMERLAAAGARRDAEMTRLNTGRAYANRSIDIGTADATAHAHGQAGVGSVLSMTAQFRDMERDAADDPEQMQRVHDYEEAKIAATKRDFTPTASYHGLSDYHDAIQTSIGRGGSFREALDTLGNFKPGDGSTSVDSDVLPDGLRDASKNMNDAAKTIKNFRGIAVIGGNS